MRVLILGGDGLLGHILFDYLSKDKSKSVYCTVKKDSYSKDNVFLNMDAHDFNDIDNVITLNSPDIIINCLGIVKQRESSVDDFIKINALMPLYLKEKYEGKIKIIHISTSCVFDGKKGDYLEDDNKEPDDCYGYSKLLGEIVGENIITLRTSFLGPELFNYVGLFDWFFYSTGQIKGFSKAVFSGVTSLELCKVIDKVLDSDYFNGLYHVGNQKINKHELLILINNIFSLNKTIIKDDKFVIDRSLITDKFDEEFKYINSSWEKMLVELRNYMGRA